MNSLNLLVFAACVTVGYTLSGSTIKSKADSHIGSTLWSYASSYRTGRNTWKCNLFVADVMKQAGGNVPQRSWWRYSPIGANEWANPRSSYLTNDRCWTRVTSGSPRDGDVAAYGGHVGFVTGIRTTTSAAKDKVVKNDWGFRSGQRTVFWRYGC